jgi:ABC-type multidrug transport system fused ATPase/permease subunit
LDFAVVIAYVDGIGGSRHGVVSALWRNQGILDAHSPITQRPDATDPPAFRGDINFEHVAFGYDPALPVLRDINFAVTPGQMVGIVGPTGSGKSTVAGLIPRFYDAQSGSIKIERCGRPRL